MKHEVAWKRSSGAAKALAVSMLLTMSGFGLAMWGASSFAERHHPQGVQLYVLAAVPSFAIFSMMFTVGVYLHKEQDEFQRMVMVRSLLCAIAGTLGVSWYASMVRGFGGMNALPPFAEFVVFWLLFGAVQMVQVFANRVRKDA